MTLTNRIKNIFGLATRGLPLDNPSVPLASPAAWNWLSVDQHTVSGEIVNDVTALQLTTVFAAVSLISQSVASLPLRLWRRTDTGKVEAFDNPLYALLQDEPSSEMTANSFWETFVGSMALTGNGYAAIQRNDAGDVVSLWPLNPRLTVPHRLSSGELVYRTSDGMPNGAHRLIASADVLHCPLFSQDGIVGLSPIQQAATTLGTARAVEKFAAKFFANSARPSGLLTFASEDGQGLDEKMMQAAKSSWDAMQSGSNSLRTAVMSGGWNYTPISVTPEECQFLQTNQYQREQIAALWHVPVHLLGDTSRLANATATQQNLSFVTSCLRSYMVKIEAEIQRKLLNMNGQRSEYFAKFDERELTRGDAEQTQQALSIARNSGLMTANECRSELGLNPVGPEGDVLLVPLNYTNATSLLKQPDTDPEPDPMGSLGSLRSAFHKLFRDAVGKTCIRSKRDLPALTSSFGALLESIADLTLENTRSRMDTPDLQHDSSKAIREYLLKMTERATSWTPEGADATAVEELSKAVKALAFDASRAAATYSTKKELEV